MKIYDYGPETIDRYTVFIKGNVYGMSIDPLWPQGFNQYVGTGEPDDYNLEGATEIAFEELPDRVREAIKRRLEAIKDERA